MAEPNLDPTEEELNLLEDVKEEKPPEQAKKEPDKHAKHDKEEAPEKEEIDPLEARAREMGWRPKEEFDGDEVTWVDAGEFVRRKPLFDEIHKNKRKVADLEKSFTKLKDHHERVREAAYKQAIEELKAEKLKALEEQDHRRVVEIDDEIAEKRANPPRPEPVENPEFDEWVEGNQWYMTDKEMKAVADRAGKQFLQTNPDADRADIYEYAESVVKKRFSDKFKPDRQAAPNSNRAKPSMVDNSSMQSRQSKTYWDRLDGDEKRTVLDLMSDIPGFNKEQYAKDVLTLKGEKV